MTSNSQSDASLLDLILIRTVVQLKESGTFDDHSLLRIQALVQQGELSNREAVKAAIRDIEGDNQ